MQVLERLRAEREVLFIRIRCVNQVPENSVSFMWITDTLISLDVLASARKITWVTSS